MHGWAIAQRIRQISGEVLHVGQRDRKSTRLNSSHGYISYAVFCLKKKKLKIKHTNYTAETTSDILTIRIYTINMTKTLTSIMLDTYDISYIHISSMTHDIDIVR